MGPLWQSKTARGTPIEVYGRTLTPVARVVSAVQHRATITADTSESSGWGIAITQPLRLVEERDGASHAYPIPDLTVAVLQQMAMVAVALPALCAGVVALARWVRRHE